VRQEDAQGCALATLAMLCDHSYEQVKATVDSWSDKPHDWAVDGTYYATLDRYLSHEGFFMQRRYAAWSLPLVPFTERGFASVEQPSRRNHFVAVCADGSVLDPLREGVFALTDWPAVNHLTGIVRP
jgi:hypothetical protein